MEDLSNEPFPLLRLGVTAVTPDRKTLTGRKFPPVKFVIHEEDLSDYCRATGEDLPSVRSEEIGATSSWGVVPPSFVPFVALRLIRSFDWESDFFVDFEKGMPAIFAGQELEYGRPLRVSESLTIHGQVVEVSEKHGKRPFDIVSIAITVTDEQTSVAFRGSMSFIFFK